MKKAGFQNNVLDYINFAIILGILMFLWLH
ncbi:MAG: hypothetical protein ETSY1_05490 [Candidatus Entotheonella factor]|uniref:Uncharacterized protein n=1 Tax=Entotheonella factor TaxID=1429438 RepID=W4LVZ5_ENTF1|nr:MAG: hypothetical protein ETSY1_05490 [Candidatus Entotheonella factor]